MKWRSMIKKIFLILIFLVAVPPALAVEEVDKSDATFTSLSVPFVVQAPLGDWSWPWQDFCEEANVVMAHAYLTHTVPTKLGGAIEMLKLATFELKNFGYEKDTNLHDTERMLREYYGDMDTKILENPTADMIRSELRAGNLVIVPAAGQLLHNPNFVKPGPRYHMVMVKGFDRSEFITNDPGTRRGDSFRYSEKTLMNGIHDLVSGDITKGPKAALVVLK